MRVISFFCQQINFYTYIIKVCKVITILLNKKIKYVKITLVRKNGGENMVNRKELINHLRKEKERMASLPNKETFQRDLGLKIIDDSNRQVPKEYAFGKLLRRKYYNNKKHNI